MGPIRYSRVPWLLDSADLCEMGEPEHSINIGNEIALGLHVPYPFGRNTDATLIVRAVRGNGNDGGEIKLSIGDAMAIEAKPRVPFYPPSLMAVQSNPVRKRHEDED